MEDPIRIFIGYDSNETVAWHVAAHSAIVRASQPIIISPVALHHLARVHERPRHPLASTEFSISRFLVPWLCRYQGWALFVDCDVLFVDDPAELWAQRDDRYAVQVVQHDHSPREVTKFLGRPQTSYPRKNWSSVMLMNCAYCDELTPRYVDNARGLDLHGFAWTDDELIGALPGEWNHLVGYDQPTASAKLIHYTLGGPWLREYRDCEHADVWRAEFRAMTHATDAFDCVEETEIWRRAKAGC